MPRSNLLAFHFLVRFTIHNGLRPLGKLVEIFIIFEPQPCQSFSLSPSVFRSCPWSQPIADIRDGFHQYTQHVFRYHLNPSLGIEFSASSLASVY